MIIALVRKNLARSISMHDLSIGKSNGFFFCISLHFSSTSKKRPPVANPNIFDTLLYKHHFSSEVAALVASKLTRLKNPEKADSILYFFKESRFSIIQLEKILKYRPRFLSASLEDCVKPKIKIFQDTGFSSDDIAKIISSNPAILQLNMNTRVIPALSVLKGLLGSNDAVAKLLRKSGWFLTKDLEKTMVPNIEFLKRFGIPMERILTLLYDQPRCFLLQPEILRISVEKAEQLGGIRSSNMFIYAIRIIASISNEAWELKLQAFRDLGFSNNDILTIFRKAPSLFSGSVEKIKKTKDFLLATGKFNMSCIVNNPMSLACSIENRYKPRLQILQLLESRNLIEKWPRLGTIYTLSDYKFSQKFISPYAKDVGQVYCCKEFCRAGGMKYFKH